MGSYHMPPRRNALIPFSILSFFMSSPRLDISAVVSLPAALRGVDGEAHRVGPVLLVGLHVFGFLFHGPVSLSVFCGPRDHRYVCRGFIRGSSQIRSTLSPSML